MVDRHSDYNSHTTHPVHSIATHPTPWQTVQLEGLAEQPETSSFAQETLEVWVVNCGNLNPRRKVSELGQGLSEG